jgi:hypothetical protein
MTDGIRLEGMEEILSKLDNLEDLQKVRPAMMAGALHIKGKIAKYPAKTKANSPSNPTGRWYERGFGTRTKTGRAYPTSETLGKKWTVANRDKGFTKVIGNNVSYGPFVQSAEKQAKFHERRGWKTDEQVIDEEQDTVLDFVKDRVDRILES